MSITTLDALISGMKPILPFYKAIQAAKAAARYTDLAFAAGNPGTRTFAAPGLNGATVDNASAIAGFLSFGTPAAAAYLAMLKAQASANVNELVLYDLLWYNTGLVVTTTTEQAITSPAWPSRCPVGDGTFDINGKSCEAWLICTGATTNAGAITNTTFRYTSSVGGSRVGTLIPDWPISATAWHISPFGLQAGDNNIISIQGITLGTSYATGSISLALVRRIASLVMPSPTVQGGMQADAFMLGMPQLASGSALYFAYNAGAAAGGVVYGNLAFTYG